MKIILKYGFLFLVLYSHGLMLLPERNDNIKQVDSLLDASLNEIYENPDKTMTLGLSVYNNTSYSKRVRAKSLMLLSLSYTSKRDYQKALEYMVKADHLAKDINDTVLQIKILFRTGILYQQLKIFDKSIDFLEKTERLALSYPVRDSVGRYLANSYTVKGFIYKDNLNCDIALEYFDKGIEEFLRLKTTQVNTNLSIAYYNKGNCYILLSEYDKAKASFNTAITLAASQNASSLIAFAQKGLAEVYTSEGAYNEALDLLQIALNNSKDVGDLVLNLGIYSGLSENYLALNQWDDYQKYYNLYSARQLDIKVSERNSISASLDESVKTKKQNLAAIKKKFYNRLKWIIVALIFIILAVFLIERQNAKDIKILRKRVKNIQTK